MATKNNAKPTQDAAIDELNQVFPPDEINDELESQATNGHSYSTTAGLSLDELDIAAERNTARDEQERSKLDPPKGNWNKVSKWTYEKQVRPLDKQAGDIDPSGRVMLNFYGKPEVREENGIPYEPTLFLRISPDVRYKADSPKEHDNSYKLYLLAKDLFLSIYGRAPKISEIVKMLENAEYIIRTFNGDTGPIIMGLQDPDQERVRSNRRNRRTSNA
jgi:hypothetical protein